jgi:xanthine dehydrogenase accessory factor
VERKLREAGVSAEQLATVHAPMGLELRAETPEEIAVSIAAEIIMLRHHGTGQPMRGTKETRHTGPEALAARD